MIHAVRGTYHASVNGMGIKADLLDDRSLALRDVDPRLSGLLVESMVRSIQANYPETRQT